MADSSSNGNRFVKQLNLSDPNLSTSWKTFKAQFEIFQIAKKFDEMSEGEKIANLLLLMGSDCVPVYGQFTFHATNDGQTKTLTNVIGMFDRHFEPVKNVIYERVKFNSMCQDGKPLHQFITDLQQQARYCDYGDVKDDLIRDRIVVGVDDVKLREYLIDLDDLTLLRCIQKAKQYVSHHEQAAKMIGVNEDSVKVSSSRMQLLSEQKAATEEKTVDMVASTQSKPWAKFNKQKQKCFYCNRHHQGVCYARNSTCNACKKRGHWAGSRACKQGRTGEAHAVTSDEFPLEGLFFGSESDSA